jgi:hypothetical protein
MEHSLECYNRLAEQLRPGITIQLLIRLGIKGYKHIREARPFNSLKVGSDCKFKLVDKYLFENADIILLIKDQHRFFVVDRVNGPE